MYFQLEILKILKKVMFFAGQLSNSTILHSYWVDNPKKKLANMCRQMKIKI